MPMEYVYLSGAFVLGFIFSKILSFYFKNKLDRDSAEKDFSHAVIHELRAHFTNLSWIFEKLTDKGVSAYTDDEYRALSLGRSTVSNANSLINDTLTALSVGRSEARFRYALNDIGKILDNIVSEYQLVAREKGIDLDYVASRVPVPLFFFDSSQVYIALHDLVHNAIKYTQKGGRVEIFSTLDDGKVTVTIRDTGIGIPKDEIGKIFTKFFRATNAKKMHEEGSGLGMYISKNIVARHNGNIKLQSREKEGTIVEVSLPLIQVEPKENKS
jgi:two-component system sensor histidine kinase VicK